MAGQWNNPAEQAIDTVPITIFYLSNSLLFHIFINWFLIS